VKTKKTVASGKWQVTGTGPRGFHLVTRHPSPVTRSAFTLIEVMVAVALLSLIVIALMAVFNSTQAAFRASVTQEDILEGGRATMDLIAQDLKGMAPSLGNSNSVVGVNNGLAAVNFYANTNVGFVPLVQTLIASTNNRTYVLQQFFILNHQNTKWWGVAYAVQPNSANGLYSLYRLQYPPDESAVDPLTIFTNQAVQNFFLNPANGGSHLIDGVAGLRVRAYDTNGVWMNSTWPFFVNTNANNILFLPQAFGETGFYMFSNALPASVEIEMDTFEDRTLQRAESFGSYQGAINYLASTNQSGKVHVFRQSVSIPNVDPSAYQ
jgi:type II secretory pathway pseudopilin PulG